MPVIAGLIEVWALPALSATPFGSLRPVIQPRSIARRNGAAGQARKGMHVHMAKIGTDNGAVNY